MGRLIEKKYFEKGKLNSLLNFRIKFEEFCEKLKMLKRFFLDAPTDRSPDRI